MKLKITVKNIDPKLLNGRATKTEKAMAYQIMKDTDRFVPAQTGSLATRAYVTGNAIVYPGPYARYLYEGVAMVDAATGKGPAYIPEVGYRFRKGAVLRPTTRPLNYSKGMHPDATDHWLDVSESRNMERWKKIAARIYANGK